MTQEEATNSCDQQFEEKSEQKLSLGFTDMERVRSHTHRASQLVASLLVSPVLPGNQVNSSYSPAAAEPIAIAVKAAKPLPVPDLILQQTVMNPKSRLPKPVFTCISGCPRRQAFPLPESSRETT